MRAVSQNIRSGELTVEEVPPPAVRPGGVLVSNAASLVSTGTERAVLELARMSPLQKARARPDLVRKVLNRARQEGALSTAQTVMNLISAPVPLGYSSAGVVTKVGRGVTDLNVGDRVACAGLGYANHAEVVFVPRNLTVPIADAVTYDEAAFVTLGSISMHGFRQAELSVGESVLVIGLGLLGQITAQICAAAGCRVMGLDLDANRVELARSLGLEEAGSPDSGAIERVMDMTDGRGVDGIIITAAASDNAPLDLAVGAARDRARIVAVGEVQLEVPRRAFFDKELELVVSRSYGPGRYDPEYEEKGRDYPIGYVRWTENRNMEAFLDLIAHGSIQVRQLISHRFPIEKAQQAYDLLQGRKAEPFLALLLEYDLARPQAAAIEVASRTTKAAQAREGNIRLGVLGAGQYAQGVLLPRLKQLGGVEITGVVTGSGFSARHVAQRYGAEICSADHEEILDLPGLDAVLIAPRHNLHASMAIDALERGLDVFLEKPMALKPEDLDRLEEVYGTSRSKQRGRENQQPILMVGFSRRYSPAGLAARQLLSRVNEPAVIDYRVNAGHAPPDHWVHDPEVGGGRLIGEMCHSVDLVLFALDRPLASVSAVAGGKSHRQAADPDTVVALLRFVDHSVATVRYLANGASSVAKERVEVFAGGNVLTIDNYRGFWQAGPAGRRRQRSWLQAAKGRKPQLADFVEAVRYGTAPDFDTQLAFRSSRVVFEIQESLRSGGTVAVEL